MYGTYISINNNFIENYNEDSDEEHFLNVNVQYLKNLHFLQNDILFLRKRMKIGKVGKLTTNLHDKKEYLIGIRNLKKTLNHVSVLKKVYRAIKFNKRSLTKTAH